MFSFKYDSEWLKSSHAQVFDPDLSLFSGLQYSRDDYNNFGLFLDSSPGLVSVPTVTRSVTKFGAYQLLWA